VGQDPEEEGQRGEEKQKELKSGWNSKRNRRQGGE
jgi:hypothetical protein